MTADQPHIHPEQLADEIFTPKEAAKFLRMSESWLANSDIPRVRLGRNVRYLRSTLLAYARSRLTHVQDDPIY